MDTIFDHDPTPEELERVYQIRSQDDMDRYLRTAATGSDTQLGEIARLYLDRGQMERAVQYLAAIKDPAYRATIELAYLHPDLIEEA
jgi:hypothetical protein